MAFVALSGGAGGSLYFPAYSYGYFDDTVYLVYEVPAYAYVISTLGGNDVIDLRDSNSGNLVTVYPGRGNDTVLGGSSTDNVVDSDGNDVVLASGNNDHVFAGAGNDVYDGGSGADLIDFRYIHNNVGVAAINGLGIVCDLKKTTAQFISGVFGTDIIRAFEHIIGGNGSDSLFGTDGANTLIGAVGNDFLNGRGGSDKIFGDVGADTLIGGLGADWLECGPGDNARDHLRYYSTSESGIGTAPTVIDRIYEFDKGGTATDDKIDLSRIDARAATTTVNESFFFRGASAFSLVGGEVRLQVVGADTLVHVDTDADPATEMNFLVVGVTGLSAVDFIF